MEAIIQQIGDQFIQNFAEEFTPEEWIDESIKACFKDCSIQWWEDLQMELTDEYINEMKDYIENYPPLELHLDYLDGELLYTYGFYKAKQYRSNWIESITEVC